MTKPLPTPGVVLKMPYRLLRRLFLHDHPHPPAAPNTPANSTIRPFTYNASNLSSRPQLPYLTIPSRSLFNSPQRRYMTIQRVKYEVSLAFKWSFYFTVGLTAVLTANWAINQEKIEHAFPTPHEWSHITRWVKRCVDVTANITTLPEPDWVYIVQLANAALGRLDDPKTDGKGLKDVEGGPPGAKDISAMSEPWRRGYVELLLLCCKAAEETEGWVIDTTTGLVHPADVVRGPSNPFPKPVQRGSAPSPHESTCVPGNFADPTELYAKLLATVGLTSKQRLDATLQYANWLESKGRLAPAAVMYEDALNLAIEEIHTPGAPLLVNPKTSVLNNKAERKPSENLLAALTALATFKARHEDIAGALPILISILQARRSLPAPPPKEVARESLRPNQSSTVFIDTITAFLTPPEYPPPPPDGTDPPVRNGRELCEEAALHLHIGEIMYTMQASTKEDGIAWTREGVDLAEEELDKVVDRGVAIPPWVPPTERNRTKTVCRQCFTTGLENWETMVTQMAKVENQARKKKPKGQQPSSGWLSGLWGWSQVEDGGRWAAEEKVVNERTQRAQELLIDLPQPREWWLSRLVNI